MKYILLEKYGQLCNNIWSYMPHIINSIRNNQRLLIYGFDDYAEYFENLNFYSDVSFVNIISKKSHLHTTYFKLLNHAVSVLASKSICGWYFCEVDVKSKTRWNLSTAELEIIRKIFQPRCNLVNHINRFFDQKDNDIIFVGVHVRRGDYKTYRGGIWYYEEEDYTNFMNQMQHILPHDKKVKFIICSNEKIKLSSLGFDIVDLKNTNMIQDLYTLSRCDYIIGPHSTFSMWASFFGQTNICFLLPNRESLKLSNFSVVKEFNEI